MKAAQQAATATTGAGNTTAAQINDQLADWLKLVARNETAAAFAMTLISSPEEEYEIDPLDIELPSNCISRLDVDEPDDEDEEVEFAEILAAIAASEAPDEFEIDDLFVLRVTEDAEPEEELLAA